MLDWQRRLRSEGLKVNAGKSEVMLSCKERGGGGLQIHDINGEELRQVDKFKYLGGRIEEKGGTEGDVKARVKASWSKRNEVSGVEDR